MNSTVRLIATILSLAVSFAVLAMLVFFSDPNLKIMVLLLALGMALQGIVLMDQQAEKKERVEEEQEEENTDL